MDATCSSSFANVILVEANTQLTNKIFYITENVMNTSNFEEK